MGDFQKALALDEQNDSLMQEEEEANANFRMGIGSREQSEIFGSGGSDFDDDGTDPTAHHRRQFYPAADDETQKKADGPTPCRCRIKSIILNTSSFRIFEKSQLHSI